MSDTTTTCKCGRPTREGRAFCEDCADRLNQALGDIPALGEELDTTMSRAKGVDYTSRGGARDSETPMPYHPSAAEAARDLKAILVSWARFCMEEQVRNSSPHATLPDDNLTSVSRFLMWRVDGLALHDIGGEAVTEITDAVNRCERAIDRPAERQYLGQCDLCKTGRLYVRPHSSWAKCDACDATQNADDLREKLLRSLDDRLCTAAEIARLSTYLGLKANRDQVRQRINTWHARGRITPEASFSDEATFRFGDVYRMLGAAEYDKRRTA